MAKVTEALRILTDFLSPEEKKKESTFIHSPVVCWGWQCVLPLSWFCRGKDCLLVCFFDLFQASAVGAPEPEL